MWFLEQSDMMCVQSDTFFSLLKFLCNQIDKYAMHKSPIQDEYTKTDSVKVLAIPWDKEDSNDNETPFK